MLPTSTFHREPMLPFIEARQVNDGRAFGHAPHSHETFSIGVVTQGHSDYLNLHHREVIGAGSVVLMNPGDRHACNPRGGQAWAYRMLYLDTQWLKPRGWQPFTQVSSDARWLAHAVQCAFVALAQPGVEVLARQEQLEAFAVLLRQRLQGQALAPVNCERRLQRVAAFIHEHGAQPLTLEQLASVAQLSPSQLVRSFKQRFGFTPYESVLNRRVQLARAHLRVGESIAEAALYAGFADQAHLQRAFKRQLAATPGHYRANSR